MTPQLISLLQAISRDRPDLKLASFGEAQIRWAIATGLGALLFQAITTDSRASAAPLWPLLRGADLAAQVLTTEHFDAIIEIIDGCEGQMVPLALLKGISVCNEHYPKPHLRSMRDIDFLIESSNLARVNSLLLKLGYRQRYRQVSAFYQKHHHDMPWFHPQKGVWVEVHRALFPPGSRLGKSMAFSSRNIKAELRPSCFEGRAVMRLSPELQIVYTASHWAQELKCEGGLFGLLDIIYLLRGTQHILQWGTILDWVQGSVVGTHLYLLLSYLQQNEIIDLNVEILADLFKKQQSFGKLNLKIAHFLIARCLVEGKIPRGRVATRNLDILWKSLLLDQGAIRNLLLIPRNIFLPFRFRNAFLN
jgi:putative nucleotidyltransferase-like protein